MLLEDSNSAQSRGDQLRATFVMRWIFSFDIRRKFIEVEIIFPRGSMENIASHGISLEAKFVTPTPMLSDETPKGLPKLGLLLCCSAAGAKRPFNFHE